MPHAPDTLQIAFPYRSSSQNIRVDQELVWWNTYYKVLHKFTSGRLEVRFDSKLRGYDRREEQEITCPYCHSVIPVKVASIHAAQGLLQCEECSLKDPRDSIFAVLPTGQVITPCATFVRTSQECGRIQTLAWLQKQASQLAVYVDDSDDAGARVSGNEADLQELEARCLDAGIPTRRSDKPKQDRDPQKSKKKEPKQSQSADGPPWTRSVNENPR